MRGSLVRRRSASAAAALAIACAVVVIVAPRAALADPAADAKDLFARGRELRAQGDCASAVGLFRKAFDLYPAALGSLRNLAECEEAVGHYASSRRAWLDLKRATLTNDDKKYAGWGADAEAAAARLAPKLASLTIDLTALSPAGETVPAAGVDVTLDGEKLAPSLIGTALERDPGRHVVRASGERVRGQPDAAVELAAGDAKHVALRVVVTPARVAGAGAGVGAGAGAGVSAGVGTGAGALPSVPPAGDDGADRRRATKRAVAWTVLGVGAASLVAGGISLGVYESALGNVNGQCSSHVNCPTSLESTASSGRTAAVLWPVFGAIGLVGVGSGIALLATTPGASSQARLVVTPTLGGASATLHF
jgi:hypothetical protein